MLLLNRIWPLDEEMLRVLAERKQIVIFEESVRSGSISEHLFCALNERGFKGKCTMVTLPDRFISQCSVDWALDQYGLSAEKIEEKINALRG